MAGCSHLEEEGPVQDQGRACLAEDGPSQKYSCHPFESEFDSPGQGLFSYVGQERLEMGYHRSLHQQGLLAHSLAVLAGSLREQLATCKHNGPKVYSLLGSELADRSGSGRPRPAGPLGG